VTRLLAVLPSWSGADTPPPAVAGLDHDTEVVFRSAPTGSVSSSSAHDWALADLAVLAAGQSAENEGFNAVCVADFGDHGVAALRSVLSIPVVGAGRGAMLYALTLGTRFSVLTDASAYQRCKKLVGEYGLDRQCASVRVVEHADAHTQTRSVSFASALAAAQRCVDEDGADVLCLNSALEIDLSKLLADALLVPVIDPTSLVYKLAETFLGLSLSHSSHAYPEPLVCKAALVSALAGAAPIRSK
jgi:allantoin racemase